MFQLLYVLVLKEIILIAKNNNNIWYNAAKPTNIQGWYLITARESI